MINLVFEVSSYRFVNASFSLLGGLSGRLLPTHRTNVDISGWLFLPPVSCHYQMNDMARFHCIGSRYPQTVRRICLSPPPSSAPLRIWEIKALLSKAHFVFHLHYWKSCLCKQATSVLMHGGL